MITWIFRGKSDFRPKIDEQVHDIRHDNFSAITRCPVPIHQ